MQHLLNDKYLQPKRRLLRTKQTPHEGYLWSKLRNRQLDGFRFIRQYSCGRYILDFFCPAEKLGIELDGSGDNEEETISYDSQRTDYLKSKGITILRFGNYAVRYDLDHVLDTILKALES